MLHLKISARFSFINPPKGHRGLRAEQWVFGQIPNVVPSELLFTLICKFLEFWSLCDEISREDMQAEIASLKERLDKLPIMQDGKEETDATDLGV